jgi:aminopeptidase N
LKEGLTVFRDQEFTSDVTSRAVKRISDVRSLRAYQFAEDASPMAHPVRPASFMEINNFYTLTVYEKGAEIVRMYQTMFGVDGFRKGMDLYFKRHDGQAVTTDDFAAAMADANNSDLTDFKRWYEQAGTPEVTFEGQYDADAKTYTVKLSQKIPDTPNQADKKPMVIPVALGLIDATGEDLIGTQVLQFTEAEQEFVISDVLSKPVPSILRNFSAPIRLKTNLSQDDYTFLSQYETYDGFNRWESGQHIARTVIGEMLDSHENGEKMVVREGFVAGYGSLLSDALDVNADKALLARAMTMPDVSALIQERKNADPEAIFKARENTG